MAEWQTHKTQNLAGATSCGFKSHHPQTEKTAKTLGKLRGLAVFSFFDLVRIKLYDNAIVQQRGESSN